MILDHMGLLQRLPGHPEGGFIGVDIFFVISGFLITSTLVREATARGRISYRAFYARRARRILPMAALVAMSSVIASFIVFWPGRAWSSLLEGLWSMLFVSNVQFALKNTDYFAQSTPSIFQHYWSLSVEEQFYVAWPVLITLTVLLSIRLRRRSAPFVVGMMAVVGLLSFGWACVHTAVSPSSAYFSTLTRGFEFVVGGLVAVAADKLRSVPQPLRSVLSLGAVLGIAASVFLITPDGGFPGPLAILPAGLAAIFIAAGTGTAERVAVWPLNTRPIGYVGDISYSLYLWHWPVIVLFGVLIPPNSMVSLVLVLAVTAGLSAASYRWVEQSVLKSNWLRPESKAAKRSSEVRPVAVIGLMTASLLLATAALAGATVYTQRSHPTVGELLGTKTPAAINSAVESLQVEMLTASERNTWNGLTPSIETAHEIVDGVLTDDCWNDRESVRNHCIIGPSSAPNSLVVFGDSMAMNWVPGLWAALKDNPEWNLSVYAKVGCPYADVPVLDTDGSMYENCDEFRDWAVSEIDGEHPEAIVLASALKKSLPGASAEELPRLWAEGVTRTLSQIEYESPIILTAPPEGPSLLSCANRFSNPKMCESSITALWLATTEATESAAGKARLVDVRPWFCLPDGRCPAVIGTIPTRRDTVHMTDAYSARLAPVLREVLFQREAALLGPA
ncbi:peptidoglycan/LPS O-acetylase OafA/YrhL [Arthrobacter sp. UYCo732]